MVTGYACVVTPWRDSDSVFFAAFGTVNAAAKYTDISNMLERTRILEEFRGQSLFITDEMFVGMAYFSRNFRFRAQPPDDLASFQLNCWLLIEFLNLYPRLHAKPWFSIGHLPIFYVYFSTFRFYIVLRCRYASQANNNNSTCCAYI